MTHHAKRSAPRRPVKGQYSLGLRMPDGSALPEPMRADGYCSRCNRDYADIISHRTTIDHRQRGYAPPSSAPKGRPGWMTAIRANPDDQYAQEDRLLQERKNAVYPPMSAGPIFGRFE